MSSHLNETVSNYFDHAPDPEDEALELVDYLMQRFEWAGTIIRKNVEKPLRYYRVNAEAWVHAHDEEHAIEQLIDMAADGQVVAAEADPEVVELLLKYQPLVHWGEAYSSKAGGQILEPISMSWDSIYELYLAGLIYPCDEHRYFHDTPPGS